MKATKHCYTVALFSLLFKVMLRFESAIIAVISFFVIVIDKFESANFARLQESPSKDQHERRREKLPASLAKTLNSYNRLPDGRR